MLTKIKTLQTERDSAVNAKTDATDRVSKNLDRLMLLESKLLAAESSTQKLEDQLKESQAATVAAQQEIDSLRDVQLESTELKSRLEAKLSMQQIPPSGQASTETELLNENVASMTARVRDIFIRKLGPEAGRRVCQWIRRLS